MSRRVFFSFHYQRDVWRINQIRSIPNITGCAAAGFQDASLWEDAKKKGNANIKRMIDNALYNTSVTIVFIGNQTANRKYVNYEIEQSIARGNGVVGIQIHHLMNHYGQSDQPGVTPKLILEHGFKVYRYVNYKMLTDRIEEAAEIARIRKIKKKFRGLGLLSQKFPLTARAMYRQDD